MAFAGFNFVPDGELAAVVSNSDTAACQLGYGHVSEARIARLRVIVHDVIVFDEEVGDGKYRSAIWVEAMLAYRGFGYRQVEYLVVDAVAYLALRGYMGNKICNQAVESKGKNHAFVYAILATEDSSESVVIQVEWKMAETA